MALFDPDKIFRSLVSAMGLTPEHIQGFVTEIVTEIRTIRAERVAFKEACRNTVPAMQEQLLRVERMLNEIRHAPALYNFVEKVDNHVTIEHEHANGHDPGSGASGDAATD